MRAKTILKRRAKLENSHFPISKFTDSNMNFKKCGAGIQVNI